MRQSLLNRLSRIEAQVKPPSGRPRHWFIVDDVEMSVEEREAAIAKTLAEHPGAGIIIVNRPQFDEESEWSHTYNQ